MTGLYFPGNIPGASEPAGYTLLTPAGHALLVYFLDRLVPASRRRLQALLAEAEAALQIGEDQAVDREPWEHPADWWKGVADGL